MSSVKQDRVMGKLITIVIAAFFIMSLLVVEV